MNRKFIFSTKLPFLFLLMLTYFIGATLSTKALRQFHRRHRVIQRNLNNMQYENRENSMPEQRGLNATDLQLKRSSHKNIWKRGSVHISNFQDDFPQRKILDPEQYKSLLKDLLSRFEGNSTNDSSNEESLSTTPLNMLFSPHASNHYMIRVKDTTGIVPRRRYPRHIKSLTSHHCSLHGLWLSAVAGAAIELRSEKLQNHVEIHTKIFELPHNPHSFITSQWTGKGIISPESPTTITIVFQEHIDDSSKENNAKERESSGNFAPFEIQLPRTAVFVGQCLVCHGNQMLKGSWIVFPAVQNCESAIGFSPITNNGFNGNQQGGLPPFIPRSKEDSIYLLKRY